MISQNIKLSLSIFICTGIVLLTLSSLCLLYHDKIYLKEELRKSQDEAIQLKMELEKIERYAEVYQTSPQIVSAVVRESEKYKIKPLIMLELIKTESNFNPSAVSKAGAQGLCQITPSTAQELARELNITYSEEKLFDNNYNIKLGTYYLAKLLNIYNKDYHRALTAYNRGPTGLKKYIQNRGTAVSRYSQKISSIVR